MTDLSVNNPELDGGNLKQQLNRALRRKRFTALALVLPLLLFIFVTFLLPIGDMLTRSVHNPVLSEVIPQTLQELEGWDGQDVPDEAVFTAFARELKQARKDKTLGRMATRLNYEESGMRGLLTKTGRKIKKVKEGPWQAAFVKISPEWGERDTWALIKRTGAPLTPSFYLASFDRTMDADGNVVMQEEYRQVYIDIFVRTLWISLLVTALCVILAYPISYLLATLPVKTGNLLMILVLLPFWTSLLVRTTSWIVLLQTQGVINDLLVWLGLIEERVQLIYNQTGTIIAMTHILLPFMVLPLYSVMKTIPPSYMRAAQSLGGNPALSFWKVYMPLTVPGVGAGSILVFILAIGYYITPALVGGRTGQMISNFIAYHMQQSLNWGLAAALGGILLTSVLALYWLYNRLVGVDNMKLG